MPLQVALSLAAATVGFVSAVFFCFGSILTSPEEIALLATSFFDRSAPVVLSLVAQKAQYLVGGLLLCLSFVLQVFAAKADPNKLSPLPQSIGHWRLVFLVALLSLSVSIPLCRYIDHSTTQQVQAVPLPQ